MCACHPKSSRVPLGLKQPTLWKKPLNSHDLSRENVCVYTHTHTHTQPSKRSRKSQGEDKVGDSGLGKIPRGHLRVCLFLDYSDRAIRKNRPCFSCPMPPSSEARKGIRPYLVTTSLRGPLGPCPPSCCCDVLEVSHAAGEAVPRPSSRGAHPQEPGSVRRETAGGRAASGGLNLLPTVANAEGFGPGHGGYQV